jgi:hypothetical protein
VPAAEFEALMRGDFAGDADRVDEDAVRTHSKLAARRRR